MKVSNGTSSEGCCTKTARFEKWLREGLLLFVDCKTVVFFANASDTVKYYSNERSERSGASVETARENGERREKRFTREGHAYGASRLPKMEENDCFAVYSVCSVEKFILEQENRNVAQKTERDVRLLKLLLKRKVEDRKMEVIPALS